MSEFTPIPGVWYKHPDHLVLFCFNPQMPDDPLPWTDNLGKQWRDYDSVKPPYDSNPIYVNAPTVDASRLEVAYNPHGKVDVEVQWGSSWTVDGEDEITRGYDCHACFTRDLFNQKQAREYAKRESETLVTRTVTTITHKTEWTEVTE